MPIAIRTATADDAEASCQVLRRSISTLCVDDHHNDPRVLEQWLKNKTPEHIRDRIVSKENFTLVALQDVSVCGVAMLTRQGEITLCYVSPEARFLGAGKLMLQALEEQALRWRLNRLVLTSTLTGKAFYERNGFVPEGAPVKHHTGIEKVFPMTKSLPDVG